MGVIGLISYLSIFASLYYLCLKIAGMRGIIWQSLVYCSLFPLPISSRICLVWWFFYLFDAISFFGFYWQLFNNAEGLDIKIGRIEALKIRIAKLVNLPLWQKRIKDNFKPVFTLLILFAVISIYYGNIKPWMFQGKLTIAAAAFGSDSKDSFSWYRDAMSGSGYLGRYEAYKRLGEYVINTYANKPPKSRKNRKFLRKSGFYYFRTKKSCCGKS